MKIAVIGGIGSGKSEAINAARQMGIECLSADEINAELLLSPDYISELAKVFPSAVVDGAVNKAELASIVFNDSTKREALNAIAHPRILERIRGSNAQIVEMPLLVEIDAQGMFDEIVLVSTPMELRLKRLELRGFGRVDAIKRINAQVGEDVLRAVATRVLDNCGSCEELYANAKSLFDEILSKQC